MTKCRHRHIGAALAAVLMGASMATSSAFAADLGGNCCTDLEERIAELESTVARKGNRKVSLTVSGWVSQSVLFWDDGTESNAYIVDNTNETTRFRFTGDAKIGQGWSAGYRIEIGVESAPSIAVNQNTDDGGGIGVRHSFWWIKNDKFGQLSVGQMGASTTDILFIEHGEVNLAASRALDWVGGGFLLRSGGGFTGGTWANLLPTLGLDTARSNLVKYTSPTLAGFNVAAAWGEDDFWDAAVNYSGDFNSIKVAFGVGYVMDTDRTLASGVHDISQVKGSASVWHVPSGLYVSGAFVHEQRDLVVGTRPDADWWLVSGGWRGRLNALGETTVYGEYSESNDGAVGAVAGVTASDMSMYGFGIVQRIDAAAMELYVAYRHFDGDFSVGARRTNLDELDLVHTGARIKF